MAKKILRTHRWVRVAAREPVGLNDFMALPSSNWWVVDFSEKQRQRKQKSLVLGDAPSFQRGRPGWMIGGAPSVDVSICSSDSDLLP